MRCWFCGTFPGGAEGGRVDGGKLGYFFAFSDAWAAASRAIGTRNGEQLT